MIKSKNLYKIYWSVACVLLGVLLAPLFYTAKPEPPSAEDHSQHFTHDHAMQHGTFEVSPDNAPNVGIRVEKDTMSGWNVFVSPENFTFTPEKANQPPTANEGHAHLYLDGEKLTRLYGTAYYLSELPPGQHQITVSLNANNHAALTLNSEEIAASAVIVQPPVEPTLQRGVK